MGIPYTVDVWWGVFAPAALSVAIRDKMNRAINDILVEPDFVAFLKNAGATAAPTTPAVFQEILVKDVVRWKIMAKRAGVQ
jgi:tripartite-type tricarboxylate transporter receptor subunit TctC